jgi:hypothetical protein
MTPRPTAGRAIVRWLPIVMFTTASIAGAAGGGWLAPPGPIGAEQQMLKPFSHRQCIFHIGNHRVLMK